MDHYEYLQDFTMNALLRVRNSRIRLEFKTNDAISFIHAHLSPLALKFKFFNRHFSSLQLKLGTNTLS